MYDNAMSSTFFAGKKGMEMWQLVMLILAALLLFFMIGWYAGLGDKLTDLVQKMGALF